jgi:hypothetical protein
MSHQGLHQGASNPSLDLDVRLLGRYRKRGSWDLEAGSPIEEMTRSVRKVGRWVHCLRKGRLGIPGRGVNVHAGGARIQVGGLCRWVCFMFQLELTNSS